MTSFSNIQTECHNREDWEYVAEWASGTVEMETAKEFKNSPEAQRLANSDAILDYIAEAIKSLRDEKVPPQMPYFVASEITSLLCIKIPPAYDMAHPHPPEECPRFVPLQ
jgi:hypothetical protein